MNPLHFLSRVPGNQRTSLADVREQKAQPKQVGASFFAAEALENQAPLDKKKLDLRALRLKQKGVFCSHMQARKKTDVNSDVHNPRFIPQFLPFIETSKTPALACEILKFLDFKDRTLAAGVNTTFACAVHHYPSVKIDPHEDNIQVALSTYLSLDEQNRLIPNPHVTELDFTGCTQLSDKDLRWLCSFFPALKTLKLQGCTNLTDAGFVHLEQLVNLRHLEVGSCSGLTDAGFEPLGQLVNLRHLDVGYCQRLTDASFVYLGLLVNLQYLDMRYCKRLTDASFVHLGHLVNLRYLDVRECKRLTDASFVHLGQLVNLRHLAVSGCQRLTDASFVHLGRLVKLRHLAVSGCKRLTDASFVHLGRLVKLEYLDVRYCQRLTDASFVHLGQLVNLRHLAVSGCKRLTDASSPDLEKFVKLEHLAVSKYNKLRQEQFAFACSALSAVFMPQSRMYGECLSVFNGILPCECGVFVDAANGHCPAGFRGCSRKKRSLVLPE